MDRQKNLAADLAIEQSQFTGLTWRDDWKFDDRAQTECAELFRAHHRVPLHTPERLNPPAAVAP